MQMPVLKARKAAYAAPYGRLVNVWALTRG
jgi:hypothetical protein